MTATPRYATPRTPSRKNMLGPATKIAHLLGLELMDHQRDAIALVTEIDDRGILVFSDVTVLLPRQNGKSTTLLILLLVRALGTPGSRCGYGAQDLKNARKMLLEVWVPLLESSALKGAFTVRAANGSEAIRFNNGSVIELLVATSTKAQHGQVWDFAVLDEAFSQVDSRVETSILPAFATRTERVPGVQWLVVSTAGTRSASPYLLDRVETRRQLVDAGITSGTGYIEYSAADDSDHTDPMVWAACNPALGITITEDAVKAELASLGAADFKRSRLCQWTTQHHDPVVPLEVWDALCDPESRRGARLVLAFDSVPDASASSIAIASKREGGNIHVEVVEAQPRTEWLVEEVARLVKAHRPDLVLVDPRTPASAAVLPLRNLGVTVTEVTTADVCQAFAAFITACGEGTLRHLGQPDLTAALTGAVRRPVGDAFAWSRRSSTVDISSLVAVTLALWGVSQAKPPRPRIINLNEIARLMDEEEREAGG